jgi:hypothetical protein
MMNLPSNALNALEQGGVRYQGIEFTPGLPPLTDPLHFIGWRLIERPIPHWHIVTLGFSEFEKKETAEPKRSGFGFELSLRIEQLKDETRPTDAWLEKLFQPLAQIVFWSEQVPKAGTLLSFANTKEYSGNAYRVYDQSVGFNLAATPLKFAERDGPLAKRYDGMRSARRGHDEPAPTAGINIWNTRLAHILSALAFEPDQELGIVETSNGSVQWITCIPIEVAPSTVVNSAHVAEWNQKFPDGIFRRLEPRALMGEK